ncbi:MAG: hypothetical protein PHR87_10935 [Sulfurospirillaceae bacterium]|nr:hypothetical protein [Sulfurospirillaceae bacterium]
MKKETLYLIEYLGKSPFIHDNELFQTILAMLEKAELYSPSKYSQEQLKRLMLHSKMSLPDNDLSALILLDKALDKELPQGIEISKKQIFHTLLAGNFPQKKVFLEDSMAQFLAQLEPVEKQIYDNLFAYISVINRALGLFFCMAQSRSYAIAPEVLVGFGNSLHEKLVVVLFNEEERLLMSNGLKELLSVYLSLYGKYLYV